MIHSQSQQIIGNRESQQDAINSLRVSPQLQLFVLADGMGGHNGGETASQSVIQSFLDYFANPIADESPTDALYTALLRANAALLTRTLQQPELQGMGTTLVAVLIQENGQFDYISVGDSPLYQFSGSLKRINANHAFAEDLKKMVQVGAISAEEAEQHPQRHAITSALTGNAITHIDQSSGCLKMGERLILASDGIQTLSHEQIEKQIQHVEFAELTTRLLQAVIAQQKPQQDNASIIVIEYTNERKIESPPTINVVIQSFRQPEKEALPWKFMILGVGLAAILLIILIIWLDGSGHQNVANNAPPSTSQIQQPNTIPHNAISQIMAASAASTNH
ncbi:PP2C family protein-serine/threonine phosphatase [Simonsiella muelleri]|uniref:PP2C family protein-serine/threonine phosphatase n=1 Tax=Simonsiella muelleri TaxID=72 RepID=UPI0023EF8232|nr:protein phosphatase 2C domain-containing protein [Simonsiella muelleri]